MFRKTFRVDPKSFELEAFDTSYTAGLKKKEARHLLESGIEEMRELQDRFYADDRWSLLIILQARDAAGKDSTIKHVMSGLNPAGTDVFSFKSPTPEELDHDFMWRTTCRLPERGKIGIFNRSYYEEVLVVRVHPEFLENSRLPRELITENIWQERFEDINAFERYLSRNGTRILKFFLHVSKEEQKRRFLRRINLESKNWKFSRADLKERALWDAYTEAYQDMLLNTSTEWAPWYVIPADKKWFTRLAVADIIVHTLRDLNPQYPTVSDEQRKALLHAKELLESED